MKVINAIHRLAVRIEDKWPGKHIHWLCILTDKFIEPEVYVVRGDKLAYFILYGFEPRDIRLIFAGFLIGTGTVLILVAVMG